VVVFTLLAAALAIGMIAADSNTLINHLDLVIWEIESDRIGSVWKAGIERKSGALVSRTFGGELVSLVWH